MHFFLIVIPAKAGIQLLALVVAPERQAAPHSQLCRAPEECKGSEELDSGFRRNDELGAEARARDQL
jgi:hypothetical protein